MRNARKKEKQFPRLFPNQLFLVSRSQKCAHTHQFRPTEQNFSHKTKLEILELLLTKCWWNFYSHHHIVHIWYGKGHGYEYEYGYDEAISHFHVVQEELWHTLNILAARHTISRSWWLPSWFIYGHICVAILQNKVLCLLVVVDSKITSENLFFFSSGVFFYHFII